MQKDVQESLRFYRDELGRRVITRAILYLGDPALFGTPEYEDELQIEGHLYNVAPPLSKKNKKLNAQLLKAKQKLTEQNKKEQLLLTKSPQTQSMPTQVTISKPNPNMKQTQVKVETAASTKSQNPANTLSLIIDLTLDEEETQEPTHTKSQTNKEALQHEISTSNDALQDVFEMSQPVQLIQQKAQDLLETPQGLHNQSSASQQPSESIQSQKQEAQDLLEKQSKILQKPASSSQGQTVQNQIQDSLEQSSNLQHILQEPTLNSLGGTLILTNQTQTVQSLIKPTSLSLESDSPKQLCAKVDLQTKPEIEICGQTVSQTQETSKSKSGINRTIQLQSTTKTNPFSTSDMIVKTQSMIQSDSPSPSQSQSHSDTKLQRYSNLYKAYVKESSDEASKKKEEHSFKNVSHKIKGVSKMDKNLFEGLARPADMAKAERMMQKMGWKGGALGKTGDGILEPIAPNIFYKNSSRGFGQNEPSETNKFKPPQIGEFKRPNQTNNSGFRGKSGTKNKNQGYGNSPKISEIDLRNKPRGKTAGYKKMSRQQKQKQVIHFNHSTELNYEYFQTNVLLHILEFVKEDTELEIVFDPNLRRNERKWIHNEINDSLDSNASDLELMLVLSEEQAYVVNEIHKYNRYILRTESVGVEPNRSLHVYKDPPSHVYLVTPTDLREEEDEVEDEEDEYNLEKETSKQTIKTEAIDKVNQRTANDMNTDNDLNSETANEIVKYLKQYLIEFLEDEKYREFRFLGSFTDVEMGKINEFLNFTFYCLQGRCCDKNYEDIFKIITKRNSSIDVIDDNGSPVICKTQ